MIDRETLEGVALDVHGRTGFDDPPVDAFDLAGTPSLRMSVKWTNDAHAYRADRCLKIPRDFARYPPRAHGAITHEAAHVLLDDYGITQSEPAARYLGAALLAPRRALDRGLRAGWDLQRLMAQHVNASAELLARRIVDLRHARFAMWDYGRLRYRIGEAHARERELVGAALETGEAQRENDLDGAWPIFDGSWRRVIVLAAS